MHRAYPRSRGATEAIKEFAKPDRGLSPLTRGNQKRIHHPPRARGPIPAHAGQPFSGHPRRTAFWAYPRSRGATVDITLMSTKDPGLSPLTRGNPLPVHDVGQPPGPIPAHAGQPRWPTPACSPSWAYPRSRGATQKAFAAAEPALGLSPLTRGNLGLVAIELRIDGPIPAHAGQPTVAHVELGGEGAYPRSRGATCWSGAATGPPMGLSPLTRGNRVFRHAEVARPGPIPAHAGQPPANLAFAR